MTGTLELVSFEKKQVAKNWEAFFVGFPLPVDQSIDVFFLNQSTIPVGEDCPVSLNTNGFWMFFGRRGGGFFLSR